MRKLRKAYNRMENREIEVRFWEVDKEALIARLHDLKAEDLGEDFLEEVIFYDKELKWQSEHKKIVRIRKTKDGIFLTFKHKDNDSNLDIKEIEFGISSIEQAVKFLEEIGLVAYRRQQKKRHKFRLGEGIVDIDTWPSVPTYVEFEGPSEEALKEVSAKLGFGWKDAVFDSPRFIIENRYKIPVSRLHYFTFEKTE